MEEKVEQIYKMVIVLIILVAINLLITFIGKFSVKSTSNTSNGTNSSTSTTNNYDVSMFKSITLDELNTLFTDTNSKYYVVYLGRETCSACVSFLPTLQSMQSKYGYTTQYLDITTVDAKTEAFEKLMGYLNKEVTLNVNGESKTQSFALRKCE